MAHARQQIRNYVATTALGSMASSTGSGEIYRARAYPKTEYPFISVYTLDETVQVENPGEFGGKRYRRFQNVAIDVGVNTNASPDNALDALLVTVEQRMGSDETMGGGVIATDLISTQFDNSGEGDTQLLTARLLYRIEFRTTVSDPETFLS